MRWQELVVASDGTHHVTPDGTPAYEARFDGVLKFHPPGLAPVTQDGVSWHMRPDGSPAYSRRFRRTFGFYEGLAAVTGDSGWHHVTPAGEDAYPGRHDWCGNFQGGRCAVRDDGGVYLHIQPNGAPAYPGRWRYAGDFRDGVAVVQSEDGTSTHIDLKGHFIHRSWFEDLDVFHKGFARARDRDGWMHVGVEGRATYSRRFAAVEPFYNGQARVERFDGGLEVISETGSTIVELRPSGLPRRAHGGVVKVLLIGLPGAGKTTVGRALASHLGLPLHRLDDLRRTHSDATIAGDYLARTAFLRACARPEPGIYEFSATGYHRVAVRQAFREAGDVVVTAWIDTPTATRRLRLSQRSTTVPLPDWGIAPGAYDTNMERKLNGDFEAGWWADGPGWCALRLDGTRPPEEHVVHVAAAWKRLGGQP